MKASIHELSAFALAAIILMVAGLQAGRTREDAGTAAASPASKLTTRLEPVIEAGLSGGDEHPAPRHRAASLSMPYFSFARLLRPEG